MSDGLTMVIPDIHERIDWIEECIDREQPDDIVFLGDYFDSWTTSEDQVHRVADWLKNSMRKHNRIHMLGNHDLSYASLNKYTCGGFTKERSEWVKSADIPWGKINLWFIHDRIIYSHAGLGKDWIKGRENYLRLIDPRLSDMFDSVEEDVFYCSEYRGGLASNAGPLWCDIKEFVPLDNYRQIFGHSSDNLPRIDGKNAPAPLKLYDDQWSNVCLDTDSKHYLTLYNRELNIKENVFLETSKK